MREEIKTTLLKNVLLQYLHIGRKEGRKGDLSNLMYEPTLQTTNRLSNKYISKDYHFLI